MSNLPTSWRREGDIDVLYLGEIAVGRVHDRGGRKDRPRWLFNLAGAIGFWRDEKTVEQARFALMLALRGWIRRAGLARTEP